MLSLVGVIAVYIVCGEIGRYVVLCKVRSLSRITITEGDSHPLKLCMVDIFKQRLSVVNNCLCLIHANTEELTILIDALRVKGFM